MLPSLAYVHLDLASTVLFVYIVRDIYNCGIKRCGKPKPEKSKERTPILEDQS